MTVDFQTLKTDSLNIISAAHTLDDLEAARVSLLGKKGSISVLFQTMGKLSPEERKSFGAEINAVRTSVSSELDAKKEALEEDLLNAQLAEETLDVTLPVTHETGKVHPISATIEEVGEVLYRLGFDHATGPEVETDYYNFTALNLPPHHPARQDHDTFYLTNKDENDLRKVLRTQTSNVQIHTMEAHKPPLRVMSIGRVYRRDSDLTHTPQFHQVEGIALDKDITFAHLKGTLQKFLSDFFEAPVNIRLRPHYFPFTEPSAEVDMECHLCKGKGCRVCKGTGWLEVLGSGMVHRNVLKAGGIDHKEFQGFAFGAGIERLAMLKYGINDLRLFYESHAQFLQHFGKASVHRLS